MKAKQKAARGATATKRRYEAFSDEERGAMRDRVQELKLGKDEGESVVLEKIAEMSEPDRAMARRVHEIIKAGAPALLPRLWYGMPAYARADGKMICFFQPARKFKTRYATLGFSDSAHLDDGGIWPNAYAVMKVTAAEEAQIRALLKKALS